MPKVAFVGLDHAGQVYSACWRSVGMNVIGIHVGELPQITEPDMPALPPVYADFGAIRDCDLVVLSQDIWDQTPASSQRVVDLFKQIQPYLSTQSLIVLSQVAPGFTRRIANQVSCPTYYLVDTLRLGDSVERCLHPAQFIVGTDTTVTSSLMEALSAFRCQIRLMSYESAELAKLAINAYLVAQVTCTNSLYEVAQEVEAIWEDVADACRADARIGPHAYLRPSRGTHGGHIERDIHRLADYALDPRLFDTLLEYNADHAPS